VWHTLAQTSTLLIKRHRRRTTKPLADSLVKNPSLRTSSPLTVSLSSSHAAQITMTPLEPWRTATPRQTDHLAAHEESRHEDHPPHVSLTSTHARRPADPQLLAPHDRWVSALRRPVCQVLWHLAGSPGTRAHPHLSTPSAPYPSLREHLHPDRVCPPLSLRDHPGPPVDGRLHPLSQKAQDAPRYPQSR